MIKQTIEEDLKEALKAKDSLKAGTLRMLKARIQNEEISKQKEFSDEEILPFISSEVKRRTDSVEAYTKGGRQELADKEESEIKILQKYMPEQLSEEQVQEEIQKALSGQTLTAADFGKAMGMVMSKLKGRASGDTISKLLKEKLK